MALGRLDAAEAAFARAAALLPTHAAPHANRGRALAGMGRWRDALKAFDRAVAREGADAGVWSDRGQALGALGRHDQALESFERALTLDPSHPQADQNRRAALRALRRPVTPPEPPPRASAARWNEGRGQRLLGWLAIERADAVVAETERLADGDPDLVSCLTVRAMALLEVGRSVEAEGLLRRVASAAPRDPLLSRNLAVALASQNRHAEALAVLQAAVALDPDNPDLLLGEAELRLRLGDWVAGWSKYRSRFEASGTFMDAPTRDRPDWAGETRPGLRLLIDDEQGLGDAIQFARYASAAARSGVSVLLRAPPSLVSLLGRMDAAVTVVSAGEPPPEHDIHAPLLSLPAILGAAPERVPGRSGYLRADGAKTEVWRSHLPQGRRIGLVWAGDPRHPNDRRRSAPLEALRPALAGVDARWISLQAQPPARDRSALDAWPELDRAAERFEDWEDTAAVVALCDAVVAVDTSVAHLAGAMGRRTLLMLPFEGEWRWMTEPVTTVWYESVRLYRQPRPSDWAAVAEQVAGDLMLGPAGRHHL